MEKNKFFKLTVVILSSLMLNLGSSLVYAGNQQYEVLKQDTLLLLSQSVADTIPKVSSFENKAEENKWLLDMDSQLSKFLIDKSERETLLKTIHYEATRAGLDPLLVLGLIQVESGFKKYAVSSVGAKGYMQVMPFWVDTIGDGKQNLFYLRTNLRYGCVILRHYLDIEKGNLFMALGRYNGSRGQAKYPNKVLEASNQFKKGR